MTTQTQTQTAPAAAGSLSLRNSNSNPTRTPLRSTGALTHLKQFDSTPIIGREFPDAQLTDLLAALNADDLLSELAVLTSERGVTFFRAQDITVPQQMALAQRLGALSGKPKASTLHFHLVTEE